MTPHHALVARRIQSAAFILYIAAAVAFPSGTVMVLSLYAEAFRP